MSMYGNAGCVDEEDEEEKQKIIDQTETNLVGLRRTIYLTLQSSLDFEEAAHKLLKLQVKPGQEGELCNMVLDCSAQQRTYEKFYGLLAQVTTTLGSSLLPCTSNLPTNSTITPFPLSAHPPHCPSIPCTSTAPCASTSLPCSSVWIFFCQPVNILFIQL